MTDRQLPLEGVRILSQAIVWAGPFASMILSDLGAEVIDVESVQHINPTRGQMRHPPDSIMQGHSGAAYFNRDNSEGFWNRYISYNFGKRGHKSITLDLQSDEGHELFLELVRKSDAFIENNAAAVVEKLGIDWPVLSEVNPRLIMVRFPGFGISGPYKGFKGYGATMEAVGGHTMFRGYRDSDPSQTPTIFHGDPNSGGHVASAVQMALIARERTGRGQLIELSQHEAVIHHTSYALLDYQWNGRVPPHPGNRHPSMAPYGVFPCKGDRRWLALAVPDDEAFAALCREMGQPELAADPRFADVVSRHHHQDDLEPIVAAWTAEHTERELMERLQAVGVPAGIVAHQPEMFDDPHLVARGYFEELTYPEVPARLYAGPMAKFEHMPLAPLRGPAPTLGQNNAEVLQGLLGVSDERLRELEERQIIGTAYLESAV